MPEYTSNYGLTKLKSGEQLSTDGYKYTYQDRENIDQKLYLGAEGHVHDGTSGAIADPGTGLSYTLTAGVGSIPSGSTVNYKFTYVDTYGNETAASPVISVATPSPVSVPGSPTLTASTTGGSLSPGTYYYCLSAYTNSTTQETTLGGRVYALVTTTTGEITLGLPTLPFGADGFNVYRRGPGNNQYWFLDSVDMTVATPPTEYVDDGSITLSCVRGTPRTNSTGSNNSIELTLPGATPTVPAGFTWKIYRTYGSATWDRSFLHWVVEETSPGSGVITPTYTDTGTSVSTGAPPSQSQVVGSPSKIQLTDAAHVQGYLPPGLLVFPVPVTFTMPGTLTVRSGTWQWRCPYERAEVVSVVAHLGVGSAPASTNVIVDVNKYELAVTTWDTIFATQGNRPTIPVGDNASSPALPDVVHLLEGDMLSVDIDQVGGGATPTDFNLVVTVLLMARYGSSTTTWDWDPAF